MDKPVTAPEPDELRGDPKGYFVLVQQQPRDEDDIDLGEFAMRLWHGRWWLLAAILLGSALAVYDVATTIPIYRSETLVTVRSESAGSLMRGQLGGLASLAGINLGGTSDRRNEYIAYLKSRELARAFIESKQLMPVLFESAWDAAAKRFRPDRKGRVPTLRDGIGYIQGIRKVSEEVKTGLITVSFEWQDPQVAAAWANEYIALANDRLRREAITEAQLSIKYLDDELSRARVESVRQSLYRLMEGRINEVMLASVQADYAFRTIDRAQAPDPRYPIRPKRLLEILIGIMAGTIVGAAFVLWRYAPQRRGRALLARS
jgi:uncharacterized protein involved in exopolysaccharide biosynthesis